MPESTLPLSNVRDLRSAEGASGRPFASLLVLRKLTVRTAANGNPFLGVELGDKTGSLSCTVFSESPAFDALKGAGGARSCGSRAGRKPTRGGSPQS
jgi:3'-5' exoribonuclease